jgi:hypothetical protein
MSPHILRISVLLRGLAVAGAVVMSLSLFTGCLDPFLIGSWGGTIGSDFFSVPRAWINLLHGESIFSRTGSDFGPSHASGYPYHPALSVVVGSWTAMLPVVASYLAFVFFSLCVLWLSAALVARRVAGENAKALAYFAMFAAPPTYFMLWNAQMHVFTVLAAACLLAGLVDATKQGIGNWGLGIGHRGASPIPNPQSLIPPPGAMLAAAGLLISLLSKPMLLLVLPLLLLLVEPTRRQLGTLVAHVARQRHGSLLGCPRRHFSQDLGYRQGDIFFVGLSQRFLSLPHPDVCVPSAVGRGRCVFLPCHPSPRRGAAGHLDVDRGDPRYRGLLPGLHRRLGISLHDAAADDPPFVVALSDGKKGTGPICA